MNLQSPIRPSRMTVLFSYGFRPFFMLAGWFALVGIGAWLWLYTGGFAWAPGLPTSQWHAHEMLFGFVVSAIAGFMLTAVPSWTSSRGFAGWPLVVLTVLWVAGRLAMAYAGLLPFALVAVAELLFLPAVAALLAPPLLRSRNRNTPLLFVLLALWSADIVFMLALQRGDAALAGSAVRFALNLVLLLITVIGGRIVPAFTANALRARGVTLRMRSHALLERAVIALMVLVVITDLVRPGGTVAGWVAAVAGLLQLVRMSGWNGHRTLRDPIVWVLHAGYVWIPAGLLLKAAALLGGFAWAAFWLHALGAGAAAVMILAVMSRASLGHTGRALKVGPAMAVSYLLLIFAVMVRVFGPAVSGWSYATVVQVAGGLWLAAFSIFAAIYTPMFLAPRVDGKSG
ncbi:NnrS family protein [Elongatibacter sediminis]|uniref:NnrS family protein n=1 Tax=Elongatibacter sediminis TaxID=3119006 RepID=A0AAW9RAE8_9GAMM